MFGNPTGIMARLSVGALLLPFVLAGCGGWVDVDVISPRRGEIRESFRLDAHLKNVGYLLRRAGIDD